MADRREEWTTPALEVAEALLLQQVGEVVACSPERAADLCGRLKAIEVGLAEARLNLAAMMTFRAMSKEQWPDDKTPAEEAKDG